MKFTETKLPFGLKKPFLLILFITIIIFRITSLNFTYSHPDEIITLSVVDNILNNVTLDTNWKNARLPESFNYPSFNFSAYLIFSSFCVFVKNVFQLDSVSNLDFLRFISSMLSLLNALIVFKLGRILFNAKVGLIASFLMLLNPLLYQDSLYARPEAFLVFLTLAFCFTVLNPKYSQIKRLRLAGFLLGLMVATKFSCILLFPVVFFINAKNFDHFEEEKKSFRRNWKFRFIVSRTLHFSSFLTMGFALGAPFAILNYKDFIFGSRYLNNQYSSGHWPHGLPAGSKLEQLAYSLNYFVPTFGLFLILASLFGVFVVVKMKNSRLLSVFFLFYLIFIFFSTHAVFFERNFSHLIPLYLIFASLGVLHIGKSIRPSLNNLFFMNQNSSVRVCHIRERLVQYSAFVLLFSYLALPSVLNSSQIRFNLLPGNYMTEVQNERSLLELDLGIVSTQIGWTSNLLDLPDGPFKSCTPGLFEVINPGEMLLQNQITELVKSSGYILVGQVKSPFFGISSSTLHTYLAPSYEFLFLPNSQGNLDLCQSQL